MAKKYWKNHFTSALPRSPAETTFEPHQHLHSLAVLHSAIGTSSVGQPVASWIAVSAAFLRLFFIPLGSQTSYAVHKLC
eukprot:2795780-Karenia_brevis.AAC.1